MTNKSEVQSTERDSRRNVGGSAGGRRDQGRPHRSLVLGLSSADFVAKLSGSMHTLQERDVGRVGKAVLAAMPKAMRKVLVAV